MAKKNLLKYENNDSDCLLNSNERDVVEFLQRLASNGNSIARPHRNIHNTRNPNDIYMSHYHKSQNQHMRDIYRWPKEVQYCERCSRLNQFCDCYETHRKPSSPINIHTKSIVNNKHHSMKYNNSNFKDKSINYSSKPQFETENSACSNNTGIKNVKYAVYQQENKSLKDNIDPVKSNIKTLISYKNHLDGIIEDLLRTSPHSLSKSEFKLLKNLINSINVQIKRRREIKIKKGTDKNKKDIHLENEHMRRDSINEGIGVLSKLISNDNNMTKMMVIYSAISCILIQRKEIIVLKEKLLLLNKPV